MGRFVFFEEPTNQWKMQFIHFGADLKNDREYVLSFDAKSTVARSIRVVLEDPVNGYASLGASDSPLLIAEAPGGSKWDVPITTEMTTYTFDFTGANIQASTSVKFAFLLALTTDPVTIDNVGIEEASEVSVKDIQSYSMSIFPNPSTDQIQIQSTDLNIAKVELFNIAGVSVNKVIKNDTKSAIVNVAGLRNGIYFVKISDVSGRTSMQKFIKN